MNKGEGDFPRNVLQQYLPFTVLKHFLIQAQALPTAEVATVPTIYGIETTQRSDARYSKSTMLQQYLPFTVLKPVTKLVNGKRVKELQQYLPFTVLKRDS